MNGNLVRAFFEDRVAASQLAADLECTLTMAGSDTNRHNMIDCDTNFTVTTQHLIKLCDAVLDDSLLPCTLELIGFGLIASDRFTWDADTMDGKRVADAIFDWSSSATNYALTAITVRKFRERLVTGNDTFDKSDYGSAGMPAGRVVWEPNNKR